MTLALGACSLALFVHSSELLATTPLTSSIQSRSGQTLGQQNGAVAKSAIILIGDGMGLAHVSGAIDSSTEPLALQRTQAIGLTRTSSANNYVTDSAAAATALSSGHKTNNGVIGQNVNGEAIPSMFRYAMRDGKSTGLVVTASVTHATPAGFYAHNKTRRDEPSIARDLLNSDLNVAIGGGRKFFEERADGLMLTEQFRTKGYTIAYTIEDILAAPQGQPLLGLLANGSLAKAAQRKGLLAQSTAKAIDLLGANPNGFILMVEGSQIDWGSHDNKWELTLGETQDFDAAVKVAFDYADAHPGTLVIVAADHETGGLSLTSGKEQKIEANWGTKNHTATMVPLYAYGSGAEEFSGIYENTEVFERVLQVLGIAKEPIPQVRNAGYESIDENLSSAGASIGKP